MIIDIEGMHGIVVSGPSDRSPHKEYSVFIPDQTIVWSGNKNVAIRDMEAFIGQAQKALEVLYGYPGGGGTSPALAAVA